MLCVIIILLFWYNSKKLPFGSFFVLTLRPLRSFAGFFETELAALFGALVASEKTEFLQFLSHFFIVFEKGSSDAVAKRFGLRI